MSAINVLKGLLIGGAVGLTAGILLAPESGEKTRRKLYKKAKNVKEDAVSQVSDAVHSLKNQLNERIDDLTSQTKNLVKNASEKAESNIKNA